MMISCSKFLCYFYALILPVIYVAMNLFFASQSAQASLSVAAESRSMDAQGSTATVNPLQVQVVTNMGNILLELDAKSAPITVKNFLEYVNSHHYDGTIFHRVIPGFVIQAGGYDKQMHEKSVKSAIKLEAQNGLKNVRGSLAMARTIAPDSATAQFYINLVDNDGLNYPNPDGHGYAVFGRVIDGMDIVDKISKTKTSSATGTPDIPVNPIIIQTIRLN